MPVTSFGQPLQARMAHSWCATHARKGGLCACSAVHVVVIRSTARILVTHLKAEVVITHVTLTLGAWGMMFVHVTAVAFPIASSSSGLTTEGQPWVVCLTGYLRYTAQASPQRVYPVVCISAAILAVTTYSLICNLGQRQPHRCLPT